MSSRNSAPHSAFAAAGGPVANFFRPVGELCENAARSTFWLYVWVLRRSKPYLWLSRGRFGRAQFARKPSVEKLCDRPVVLGVPSDRLPHPRTAGARHI